MKRLPVLEPTPTVFDDNLTHIVCCHDDDTSLCGKDVTDDPFVDDEDDTCVVCDDLKGGVYCPHGYCCPIYDEVVVYVFTA